MSNAFIQVDKMLQHLTIIVTFTAKKSINNFFFCFTLRSSHSVEFTLVGIQILDCIFINLHLIKQHRFESNDDQMICFQTCRVISDFRNGFHAEGELLE